MGYRPRIHCLIPHKEDATSYYRAQMPLSKLKHLIDCDFVYDTNISWASLAHDDIMFVQRPWGQAYYKACQIAVNNRLPIWIDYDDYLLDIPEWNPGANNFSKEEDQQLMLEMISMATVVTVTTKKLHEKFSKHNENVFVVPNALDDFTFQLDYNLSNKKIVNWRGSTTHKDDLRTILENLRTLQNRMTESGIMKDWLFNFIGDDSKIMKGIIQFKNLPSVDPIEYFHMIKKLNPTIQLVPLVNHEFNHAKSNIAWIEATYSGAVTLAAECFEEFNRPGIQRYKDSEDFLDKLQTMIFDWTEKDYKENYDMSFNFINQNLRLSEVNQLRKQIVVQLMSMKN